jgi:hypothetical protein
MSRYSLGPCIYFFDFSRNCHFIEQESRLLNRGDPWMGIKQKWKTPFWGKKRTIYLKKSRLYLLDMFDLLWFKSPQVVKDTGG